MEASATPTVSQYVEAIKSDKRVTTNSVNAKTLIDYILSYHPELNVTVKREDNNVVIVKA